MEKLKGKFQTADMVVIGAGAGLSTSAGFVYSGERFGKYFFDFAEKYSIGDMYSGGFYPYDDLKVYWAWWSRQIWVNRYMDTPKSVYEDLLSLVEDKDYFVLTTNVDHCFQKAGFDKKRLFYTQGDYGLWQCSEPCHNEVYDNEKTIRDMILAQGFEIAENGDLYVPDGRELKTEIPSELVPYCPKCGQPMTVNLRSDDNFVEDEGWHLARNRYSEFLRRHKGLKTLFLELGVGGNTPVIIKYPFWRMTADNKNATYVCVNYGESFAPEEIENRSICIDGDIARVVTDLKELMS